MSPGWINFTAAMACTTAYPCVLLKRDPNDNLMSGHPDNLIARSLHLRDVLEYLRAKDAIERVGGEIKFCNVSAAVTTRGISKAGLCKSSAVTSEKYSVSNREKCPSLAPMSSTDRRFLGSKRSRSFVRTFSSSLARYFSRYVCTLTPAICLRFCVRTKCNSDSLLQMQSLKSPAVLVALNYESLIK